RNRPAILLTGFPYWHFTHNVDGCLATSSSNIPNDYRVFNISLRIHDKLYNNNTFNPCLQSKYRIYNILGYELLHLIFSPRKAGKFLNIGKYFLLLGWWRRRWSWLRFRAWWRIRYHYRFVICMYVARTFLGHSARVSNF